MNRRMLDDVSENLRTSAASRSECSSWKASCRNFWHGIGAATKSGAEQNGSGAAMS
jgi:hypothetical protein